MKKDPKVFIAHILESIERIEKYTQNLTKDEFLIQPNTRCCHLENCHHKKNSSFKKRVIVLFFIFTRVSLFLNSLFDYYLNYR